MHLQQKTLLNKQQMSRLRENNTITAEEYAYVAGDLLVAENVKTSEKRVLGQASALLSENNKRVLKG